MLSPVSPSQFFAVLAAGLMLAAMAAIFARLDAVARRMIVVRRTRSHRPWRQDND